jgi:hypothetical protein
LLSLRLGQVYDGTQVLPRLYRNWGEHPIEPTAPHLIVQEQSPKSMGCCIHYNTILKEAPVCAG